MNPGELDRRITVQTLTESVDDYGQLVQSFSTLASLWAKVEEKSGNEGDHEDQIKAVKNVAFTVRHRNDINERMRVVYNSNTYLIQAVIYSDQRNRFVTLSTKVFD
jgi:SPP1 family predicted phage head-tail adaptor